MMHRHILEGHLERLWEETGVEFKFVRSSDDSEDMAFFRASQPQTEERVNPLLPQVVRWFPC